MAEVRKALLIGVKDAPEAGAEFESLADAVAADMRGLRAVLEQSNYEPIELHNPGRAEIGAKIFEVSQAMPPESTLLIYFTGHGIRLNNTDYLVPADARAPRDGNWRTPYRDSLLQVDISEYLSECSAGTVLWIIDACRNEKTGSEVAFGTRAVQGQPSGRYATMVGCGPGERCGYTDTGSFFTRGLIEAMSSLTAPTTVHEVYEKARTLANRRALDHQQSQQLAQIHYGSDQEQQTRTTTICAGRHLMDGWQAAVQDEKVWKLVDPTRSGGEDHLRKCLLALVDSAARVVQDAQVRLRDPWVDDNFVPRLLERELPRIAPAEPALSALEVAVLVAAVLLREASWASYLSQASEVAPERTGRLADASPLRIHFEQVQGQFAHTTRRLDTLEAKGRQDDRRNVALWLVHQWIGELFAIEDKLVRDDLAQTFAQDVLGSVHSARVPELADLVSRLAASVGSDRSEQVSGFSPLQMMPVGETRQQLRERPLTTLLRVANTLAVDVRGFPEIVAEHLSSPHLEPRHVVAVAEQSLDWFSDDTELHMDVVCSHRAVHDALTKVAEAADQLVRSTPRQDLSEPESRLLTSIPHGVTASGLRAQKVDGVPAYDVPLLRFRLAQSEVRDLLMGRQLYGNPELALRELYQNAMDACRYRAMRWEFLRLEGRTPQEWEGRISIVQGRDDRGRYVECRDTGVGMSEEQLKNTFTRAGSRFEHSRAFREEQLRWLRLSPELRLYPNSRFGIGVFSYFMIADEMEIVTRPVSQDGRVQDALHVEVSGSASLFSIQPFTGPGDSLPEGGTRVRLYLRDDPELETLSCERTLRSLVVVSDFLLEVSDADSPTPVRWEAKRLSPYYATWDKEPTTAVPDVLWWVDGQGAILCDGVATDTKPFGYVINLTRDRAGTLSVNRNELQDYDEVWVKQKWLEGVPALLEWPGLTMAWLWRLDEESLPVARVLWQDLLERQIAVHIESGHTVPLSKIGIFSLDRRIQAGFLSPIYTGEKSRLAEAWRASALEQDHDLAPRSLDGYPVAHPGDAEIIEEFDSRWLAPITHAADGPVNVSEVLRGMRRLRVCNPRLAPPPMTRGKLDWIPSKIEGNVASMLMDANYVGLPQTQDLHGLATVSLHLHRPLGWLIEVVTRFAPLYPFPIPSVPAHHENYICTDTDIAMLYLNHKEEGYAPKLVSHPADLRKVSKRTGEESSQILKCLERFRWLGWTVPDADAVDRWMLAPEELFDVLCDFGGKRGIVDFTATVVFAMKSRITLEDAENAIAEGAAIAGLTYERRLDSAAGARDIVPSAAVSELFSEMYPSGGGLGARYGDKGIWHSGHVRWNLNVEAEVLEELAQMGIDLPDEEHRARWARLPWRARLILDGRGHQNEVLAPGPSTECVLFAASAALGEPLGDVWDAARQEAPAFGLSVPDLPDSLRIERPTHKHQTALVSGQRMEWQQLTMGALARCAYESNSDAGTAYEAMAPLRVIGALVPELPPHAIEDLRTTRPDRLDVAVLEGDFRVTKRNEPLVALDVVSIAGRVGESISQAWQRIKPYLPLGPEPEVTVFPDVLPLWQDLIILSRYLNGLLPALAGKVEPEHVAFLAHELEESESWVWGRLRLYAEMFDLDLSLMPEKEVS